jgi:transcriptional regulator with XRE-family HTH domain
MFLLLQCDLFFNAVAIVLFCKKKAMGKKVKMNRIQEVLDLKERSQSWLSRQVNRSRPTINSFCQNDSQPSLDVLFEIADALEVGITKLIGDRSEIIEDEK